MLTPSIHRHHWQLNPDVTFLNHGSFGATPTAVLNAQRDLQNALEKDPIQYLAPERELEPKLDRVRELIARFVGADSQDLAFVRNATDGVNAVVRSFPFKSGDELIVTNHGYNACNNAARFAADRAGAIVREARLPFPLHSANQVLESIEAEFSDRTRFLLVDHVTSPTGLVLPVGEIVARARSRGIRVMIDAAHAPGMVPVDVRSIDADYYTANHHKWLCGPKVSGFLWVRRELQNEVRPTIISHGANRPRPNRSRFLAEFDWTGTYDPTPLLAMESAFGFLTSLFPGGIDELMQANRVLALEARTLLSVALEIEPPAPKEMIGSLVTMPLPERSALPQPDSIADQSELDPLQRMLMEDYRIEVPVYRGPPTAPRLLRTSSHIYNHISDYVLLATALRESHAPDSTSIT